MILKLQNLILEMIARGEPLTATIGRLCLEVERLVEGTACSVLTLEGQHLTRFQSPSLPNHDKVAWYIPKTDAPIDSSDPATDQTTETDSPDTEHPSQDADVNDPSLPPGFEACWSKPIFSGSRIIATFMFYYRHCRGPSELERQIVDACVNLCAIAIEREARVRERERLTYTDALTGLPNRARFNLVLAEYTLAAYGSWGVLLADMDNLKLVNDTFGHATGDDLIQIVGQRIASVMKPDMTFRIGGDEFAIIVQGATSGDMSAQADQIFAALRQPARCHGHVILPAVTLGGSIAQSGDGPDEVRQCADIALYHAKERKRGQYVEYAPGLGTALTRRFRAIRDVGLALAEDRIDAHYQPIVRLDTGDVVGFEALCRMTTASGDIIAAANFHEATKDAHVAAELTQCMLLRVAKDMRQWLDMGLPLQHVGINLAAADFHSGDLQDRICTVFADAGVPMKHIILEVTESVYLGQRDHVVADEIKALRARGMRVALDDFGTGFASLTHLLTVPVDVIKIDKSFVERLVPGDAAGVIVEGVMGIATKLGLRVVAEGIETNAQREQLQAFGCRLGQGYLFSKAVDRAAAVSLLAQFGQGLGDRRPLRA